MEEGRPAEDSELIERSRAREADAYEQLVVRYQGVAVRTAYVITGRAQDAEEVAQDAFVKAYAALGRFRAGAPFRPWLLRIVANEALNRRRSSARHATVELTEAMDRPSDDATLSPEHAALAAERRAAVRAAVGRLRDDDRLVIAYRWFLELSEAEMAEALGIARGTVKSRLSRAMDRLREVLDG